MKSHFKMAQSFLFLMMMLTPHLLIASSDPHGAHEPPPFSTLTPAFVNFFIFMSFLFVKLKGPLTIFFQEKRAQMEREYAETQRDLKEADVQLSDIQSKVNRIDHELRDQEEAVEREAIMLRKNLEQEMKGKIEKLRQEYLMKLEAEKLHLCSSLSLELMDLTLQRTNQIIDKDHLLQEEIHKNFLNAF